MKRNCFHLGFVMLIAVGYSSSCLSNNAQMIYGLEKAKQFNGRITRATYIQVGSFVDLSKASQYQRLLQSKTNQPVVIMSKGRLHAVLIGPLRTVAQIRVTAVRLSQTATKPFKKPTSVIRARSLPIVKKPSPPVHVPKYRGIERASVPIARAHPVSAMSKEKGASAKWYIGVGGGVQFPDSASSMQVNNGSGFPAPFNQDTYAMSNGNGPVFLLSAGRRWERQATWFPSYAVGLSWQHYFDSNTGRTIMQYSDPAFLNYGYHWNFSSNLLLASAKLNLVQYAQWSPYLNGGLGAAFNETGGYSEAAFAGVTPRVSPQFSGGASTQFGFQIGAGLDWKINPQAICSFGYNYQNLGGFSSGPGKGSWAGQRLTSGSYGSNEVLVSVNYLFGK